MTGQNVVLYVTGEAIGEDYDLGRVLMTGFLKNIKEMEALPGTIIFVNAGVKITTAASAVVPGDCPRWIASRPMASKRLA